MSDTKTPMRPLALVTIVLLMLSCGNNEDKDFIVPPYVLSEEQYVKLLVDLSLAESASNLNIKNYSGTKYDSAYLFNPVKENGISQQAYDSTLKFYSRHPEQYKKIQDEVLNRLSELLTKRVKTIAADALKS